jgi:hypothetical protein
MPLILIRCRPDDMCEESQTFSGLIRSKKSHTIASMHTLQSIIAAHGGNAAVARSVSEASGQKCSPSDISYWLRHGSIPAHFVRPFVDVVDAAGIVELGRADVLALLRVHHDRRVKNHAAGASVPQATKKGISRRRAATPQSGTP